MGKENSSAASLPTQPPAVPAPVGRWVPDILGPGFEARTLELPRDDEGELCATLVRHRPQDDRWAISNTPEEPTFTCLFIHGWNDYFFQRELARHISLAGGAFYAIDLCKYGRSLRKWQTFGWTEDLLSYDLDIYAALEFMREEHPGLPLVMAGHSTGGLTAAYWVNRHRDQVAGLLLDSPWIEMAGGTSQRFGARALAEIFSRRAAKKEVPLQSADSAYVDSLMGWDRKVDGTLPKRLEPWLKDPSLQGWPLVSSWKGAPDALVRFGWVRAITIAQKKLLAGEATEVPTYFLTSTASSSGKRNREMMFTDSVLNVHTMCENAWRLSRRVTLERYPGKHDLFLSFPDVRQKVWFGVHRWLAEALPGQARPINEIGEPAARAICP